MQFFVLFLIIVFIFKYTKKFPLLIFISVFLYSFLSKQLSVSVLDNFSFYSLEGDFISKYTGAGWRHLFYNLIILFSTIMMFINQKFKIRERVYSQKTCINLAKICFFALALQILNVFLSGLAFTGDRHELWLNIPFVFIRNIFGILLVFVPFYSGYMVADGLNTKRKKIITYGILLLCIYFFFLLASSQGFNGLLVSLLFFISPLIVKITNIKKTNFFKITWFKVIISFIILLLLLVVGSNNLGIRGISSLTGGGLIQNFVYRAGILQGSLYYLADLSVIKKGAYMSAEILFEGSNSLLPTDIQENYLNRSVNVAGSLPAVLITVFGFIGAIPFLSIYGIILGTLCILSKKIIIRGHPVSVILISYINLWTIKVYFSGSISHILEFKYLFFILLIFFNELFQEIKRKKVFELIK